MTGGAGRGGPAGIEDAWERFRDQRAAQLNAWISAERALAAARRDGVDDLDAGERLLTAEATLQTAIVDFAASQPGVDRPSRLAIEILRRAEAMLDSTRSAGMARARALRSPGNPRGQDPGPPRAPRPRPKPG